MLLFMILFEFDSELALILTAPNIEVFSFYINSIPPYGVFSFG